MGNIESGTYPEHWMRAGNKDQSWPEAVGGYRRKQPEAEPSPRMVTRRQLRGLLLGSYSPDAIDAIFDALPEQPALDVERLARALVDCGLMHRLLDYAQTAHSSSMQKEDETTVAHSWADPLAAAYARLAGADAPAGEARE